MTEPQKIKYESTELWTIIGCLAVIGAFWVIPPISPITAVGMKTIGIFIGTVLLLSLVDTVWPVFLSLCLLTLTGGFSWNEVLAGSIGSWIITFVIASFIMTFALNKSGFTSRLTEYYMTRNFVKRSPWAFTFSLFSIAMIVGMFMDQVPATAFFLTFTKELLKKMGYSPTDRYSHALLMGTIFSVNIGGAATPISHSLVILGIGIYQKITGIAIDLVSYMIYAVPVAVVLFIFLCVIVRFVMKPDVSKLECFDLDATLEKRPSMNLQEKITVGIFFGTVWMWILPGILTILLPKEHVVLQFLSHFSITFWAVLAVILLSVIRINNEPIIRLKDTLEKGFPWGVTFFISIGVLLGSAVSKPEVGLSEFIIEKLTPLFETTPAFLLVVLFAFLTVVLTNFASNVTTITVMTGVATTVALTMPDLNAMALAITTTMCGSLAFVLPSSFAPIAMLHGDEYTDSSIIIKYGTIMVVCATLATSLIGYQIIHMLGIM